MTKKIKNNITKLDVTRWFIVFPVSVFALILYDNFSGWLNKLYLLDLHGNGNSTFLTYINCLAIPSIVLLSGFLVSPKFKFNSTLILSAFYSAITVYAFLTSDYLTAKFNPFFIIFILAYLAGLFIVYKLDKK